MLDKELKIARRNARKNIFNLKHFSGDLNKTPQKKKADLNKP